MTVSGRRAKCRRRRPQARSAEEERHPWDKIDELQPARGTHRVTARRLTPRQESFAREIASGCSGAEAARRAGYSARRANRAAWECVTNRDVAARVAELQAIAVARVPLTLEAHIEELRGLQKRAENLGHYAAAIRAIEIQCKVLGYFKEPPKPKSTLAQEAVKLPSGQQVEMLRAALRRLRAEAPEVAALLAEELTAR